MCRKHKAVVISVKRKQTHVDIELDTETVPFN